MKKFASSLLALWAQLGLNQRVSLAVAALAVIGGMIAVVLWSRRPDYQLLYARLGDKDSAAVISYLQSQNIPHQISAGGATVSVPAERVYKLRMDLAAKGLPSGEGVGFEIFDKGQFGLSDFVQRTNYLRALQGELARTIGQLSGVRAARVMIVQPENRLLLTDNGVKPTASVFVDMGGGRLETDQVNAIRHPRGQRRAGPRPRPGRRRRQPRPRALRGIEAGPDAWHRLLADALQAAGRGLPRPQGRNHARPGHRARPGRRPRVGRDRHRIHLHHRREVRSRGPGRAFADFDRGHE
ncbi:MAG: flagellar basal-body MS-ring/collar protein FliF [Lacunisphaera sp.]